MRGMLQRADDRSPRRARPGGALAAPSADVLAMLAVGLALRLGYALLVHGSHPEPSSDSVTYDTIAWNLARGMGFQLAGSSGLYPTAFSPPGLPFVLSLLYRTVGHSFLAAVVLMCVLGALVPAAARALGRAMFGPAVGRIAGWLVALDPLLVFFSGYVMTESLFTLLLLVALVVSVSWLKRPSGARALGAGLLWGAATLTRPVALPLPVLTLAWAWGPLGLGLSGAERRRQAALLLLGTALCIAPWTIRNAVSVHALVPITTGGGRSLLDANNAVVWDDPEKRGGAIAVLTTEPWASRYRGLSEVEVDRRAGREALAFLRSRPGEWAGAAAAKLGRLWRWSASTPSTGSWASEQAGLARRLAGLDPLLPWSIALFPLAGWGLVRTIRGTRRHFQLLPLWLVAAFSLGSVVYWGALRLRVPVEPLVVLYAGAGVADLLWRARVRRAGLAVISSQRR